jgi:hypothetical protein
VRPTSPVFSKTHSKHADVSTTLPFVFTDIEAVVILAVVLIAVYIVGSYWKHRTLKGYAHWFDENLSSKGKVKFASHGHAGLRVKCEFRDGSNSLKEMHFALTLGARENLMYYPLALLSQDADRLNCWALLHKPIQSSLRIIKQSDRKSIGTIENNPRLSALKSEALGELGYFAYASDGNAAFDIISKASILSRLKAVEIESIEFDRLSSMLHVSAKLRKDSLSDVVDFMFLLANSV